MASNQKLLKIRDTIEAYLQYVIQLPVIASSLPQDRELQKIIFCLIDVHASINKQSDHPVSDQLLTRFVELTHEPHELNTKCNLQNTVDLIDQVNWLVTYCKNRYNIDITTHHEFNHDQQVQDLPDEVGTQQFFNQKINDDNSFNTANTQSGNWTENVFWRTNFSNVNPERLAKLKSDIMNGKFYFYDSKPKIIPQLKNIFYINSCVFQIILLALSAVIFIATFASVAPFSTAQVAGVITSIIALLWACYFYRATKVYFKHFGEQEKKNEMSFYYFNLADFTVMYWLLGFFIAILAFTGVDDSISFLPVTIITANPNNAFAILFTTVFSLGILSFIVNVVVLFLARKFNPKCDNKIFQEILKKYMTGDDDPAKNPPRNIVD